MRVNPFTLYQCFHLWDLLGVANCDHKPLLLHLILYPVLGFISFEKQLPHINRIELKKISKTYLHVLKCNKCATNCGSRVT